MYKIEVLDGGKYGNVVKGNRYTFTKRALKRAMDNFDVMECNYRIYKFVHLSGGLFAWSQADAREAMKKICGWE